MDDYIGGNFNILKDDNFKKCGIDGDVCLLRNEVKS